MGETPKREQTVNASTCTRELMHALMHVGVVGVWVSTWSCEGARGFQGTVGWLGGWVGGGEGGSADKSGTSNRRYTEIA